MELGTVENEIEMIKSNQIFTEKVKESRFSHYRKVMTAGGFNRCPCNHKFYGQSE